ncbi:MAG: hypothetical protein FWH57_10480 [Oscillospiraceae bacterium]|nr:hypothetical protein [Oscillospiraceae bacterium]
MDDLVMQSELFPLFNDIGYMLFSKTGFTDELRNRAKNQDNISLIDVEDMF